MQYSIFILLPDNFQRFEQASEDYINQAANRHPKYKHDVTVAVLIKVRHFVMFDINVYMESHQDVEPCILVTSE